MNEVEEVPPLDENGIPIGATAPDISDEEWLELMALVPVEPGNDADSEVGDTPGEPDDDWFTYHDEDLLDSDNTEIYDPKLDVDLPEDAEEAEVE